MFRIEINKDGKTGNVITEKAFDDVTKQGEIEGLTFDKQSKTFLLLYLLFYFQ